MDFFAFSLRLVAYGSLLTIKLTMMKKSLGLSLFLMLFLFGCIEDDIIFDTVEESIRITAQVDTLAVGDAFLFEARFTNNIGQTESRSISWRSSDPSILTIDEAGMAEGLAMGEALVMAGIQSTDNGFLEDTIQVVVAQETVISEPQSRAGAIQTTSSYVLTGDFTYEATDSGVRITFGDDYMASRSLPGLYLYLTNNPNSVANALEIGKVSVFAGAHTYDVPDVGLNDYEYLFYYCKPFRVKVGDGKIN